jgi:hypothetical protein
MFTKPSGSGLSCQEQHVRARTALACCLAVFAALNLGLMGAMDLWLPQLRDPCFGYKAPRLRHRVAEAARQHARVVVVLGSSRTVFGVKSNDLEQQLTKALGEPVFVFNFGIPGSGPLIDLINLRRLFRLGIQPDLLVMEVLPPFLAGQPAVRGSELQWISATQLTHEELDLLESYGNPVEEMRTAWWEAVPVPWFSRRFNILSWLAPNWLPMASRQDWFREIDDSGWTPSRIHVTNPEQVRDGTRRAHDQYINSLAGFELGGPSCHALRELLEECRQRRVRTALLLMPEGSEFRSWYSPQTWAEIQGFLDGLSREYDAPLINARNWMPDDAFCDSHHMIDEGAAAFTQRLGKTALVPLLRPADPR